MLRTRSGFTLPEVLVALVLTAVVGAAITSVFASQSALMDRQSKGGFARGVSRGAANILAAELRMLERGNAIDSASAKMLTIRAPYAMGIVCSATAGVTISTLPYDTMLFGGASFSGYLHRLANGSYTAVDGGSAPVAGSAATCTGARIGVGTNGVVVDGSFSGRVVRFPSVPSPAPLVGAPVLLYQRVTYEFRNSTNVPGRIALWRHVHGSSPEELLAPFDTTARFRYFVNDSIASRDLPPSTLSQVTGVELILDGLSDRPDRNGTMHGVQHRTAVFFQNRL